jgi:hypothetical protein
VVAAAEAAAAAVVAEAAASVAAEPAVRRGEPAAGAKPVGFHLTLKTEIIMAGSTRSTRPISVRLVLCSFYSMC